jgi:hypothetical protein
MVGIEVPNTTFGSVGLRGVMESTAFQKLLAKTRLALALGKGAGGETVVADLAKMPITKMSARITGPEKRNLRKDFSEPFLVFFCDGLDLLFPLLFLAGIVYSTIPR